MPLRKYFCLIVTSIVVASVFAAGVIPASAESAPVVATLSGSVRGTIDGGVASYRGIPFAAPPVGPLRWQPPQAPRAWMGVREATAFAGTCAQSAQIGYFGNPSATEDCLYLNVAAPSAAAATKRAVMVWFPGGGLYAGSSSEYDLSALAKAGVVVVSINYRVGLLGFFAHPAIDAEAHDLGDYGLMDQQFALHWVQQNIAAFGGDSGNVTIFGESSGAVSAIAHLLSPGSAHLFERAIMESGGTPALTRVLTPLAKAESNGVRFAEKVGCSDAACLRALTPQQITSIQQPYLTGLIGDTKTLPVTFHDAFRSGAFNRVPLIMGSNRDEWRWPAASAELNLHTPLTAERYSAALSGFFGTDGLPNILAAYPLTKYPSPSEALGAAETDGYIGCGTYKLDQLLSPFVAVYGYQFDDRNAPMYMPPVTFPYGAAHTIELQFLFPGFHGGDTGTAHALTAEEGALSRQIVGYWTNFAKTGNPNGLKLPVWPRYDVGSDTLLSLTTPKPITMHGFAAQHQCEFWETVNAY